MISHRDDRFNSDSYKYTNQIIKKPSLVLNVDCLTMNKIWGVLIWSFLFYINDATARQTAKTEQNALPTGGL